ncbi:WD repeat-containing protein 36-like isoform X2 [Oopsacas minuta]|uniref:WD repeat-containing protein 36-like isoform X2 n=1 Tax=Oopsacas minuta TaxID=111878 RepID=A0AAV7K7G9_9METZ|nr:WD repeat-containing protein 36-like isoform X2 [Oopsacas minuta]
MSQLFSPYHAIGLYSQDIPFSVLSSGNQQLLATAIDESFHLYSLRDLQLMFVGYVDGKSEDSESNYIQSMLFHNGRLYIAQGDNIRVWNNGRIMQSHRTEFPASLLLGCGKRMLSVEEGSVRVWECENEDRLGEEYLQIEFDSSIFKITSIVHPTTYVNKVLFGSHQGSLQLWNICKNILVYEFRGWSSPVLALEQSPSLDVIAIGLMDGTIHLHDIKFDQPVLRFSQDSPVTCLSFRQDGESVLVSGSKEGQLSVWDLEKERLKGVVCDAHLGSVISLSFIGAREVAVSASNDNTIKMWVFDEPDGLPRLLRSRSGHAAPPSRIRFFSPGGLALLSASQDGTFRLFSLVRSSSVELSQGHTLSQSRKKGVSIESLRLPAITEFSVEMSRADDWDCIASVHSNLPWIQTWHLFRKSVGQHRIKSPHNPQIIPTCVCSSPCGNYIVVGDSSGHVELFNIQSGQHRGCYAREEGVGAHNGDVRGVAINSTCSVLFSLGTDGVLRFWNLTRHELVWQLPFKMTASRLILHRDSGLIAIVLDDFSIQIVDADNHKVVRTFHTTSQTTDLVFSPDARWLIVSLFDSTIRVWDIPTGRMIDCFRVGSLVTSLAISPTGEALATAHADSPGVYLWSNRTLYGRVSLKAIDELAPIPAIQLPRSIPEEGSGCLVEEGVTSENRLDGMEEMDYGEYCSPNILDAELLSLAGLSRSHWYSLSKLDIIKERNKPTDPLAKPKLAPFFLPTQADTKSFSFLTSENGDSSETKSRVMTRHTQEKSTFLTLLTSCNKSGDYSNYINLIKEMGPAAIDVEIRLLGPDIGGSVEELDTFLDFLLKSLEMKTNYELVQALMDVFLRVHSSELMKHGDILGSKTERLCDLQENSWSEAANLMRFSLCLIELFKKPTL